MMERRGFLRGLATLPLVGGSVALIGAPSAVAGTPTFELLDSYRTWLHYEHRWLLWEMAGDPEIQQRFCYDPQWMGTKRHKIAVENLQTAGVLDHETRAYLGGRLDSVIDMRTDAARYHDGKTAMASSRAALVLSAVGCDWRTA